MKTQKTIRNPVFVGMFHMKSNLVSIRFALDPSIWLLTGLMLIGLLGPASMSPAEEGTWTKKADMPTARTMVATRVVDGKIYAIGGAGDGGILSTVEEYTPESVCEKVKNGVMRSRMQSSDWLLVIGEW